MTDKEIKKALECCKKDDCDSCPNNFGNCYANLAGYALDLINRREGQIDRLMEECGKQSVLWSRHFDNIFESAKRTTKAEAIKEFAERLKVLNKTRMILWDEHIDNLVKEMTEGQSNGKAMAKWIADIDECEICATVFECSCCGETFCTSELTDKEFLETMKFCPNCGAAMRDETESDFPPDYTYGY